MAYSASEYLNWLRQERLRRLNASDALARTQPYRPPALVAAPRSPFLQQPPVASRVPTGPRPSPGAVYGSSGSWPGSRPDAAPIGPYPEDEDGDDYTPRRLWRLS